jgi:hypothetical protein
LEVLRTKTISLIPTTRPVQTGISAIPDLGRAGKWGCEPRGAPPLGRHHEQVTLLNICSLGMYRTQPRPARPGVRERRHEPEGGDTNPAPRDPHKHRNNARRCVFVGEEGDGSNAGYFA